MPEIKESLAEIIKGCSRCGFCMVECPAYGASKIEWDAARGRVKLAFELVCGNLSLEKDLDDIIDTCLMCRSCYEHCASKIDTPKAVQLLRTLRYKSGKMKLPYRMVLEKILSNKGLMAMGTRVMSGAQDLGLNKLLDTGIIVKLFPEVGAIGKVLPILPKKRARKILPSVAAAEGKVKAKVVYFLGCAVDFAYPDVAQSTVKFLQCQGIEVIIPEVSCCGLPAYNYGHEKVVREMAKSNLERIDLDGADAVVSDCATCLSFLKEYPEQFTDEIYKEKAEKLSGKIKDLSELILEIGLEKPIKEVEKRITYHQPCHIGRFLGKTKEVEKVLKNLPGITYIKSANQNECCGGAGSYCITQQKRSEKILQKKITGVRETGADVLVTNCPACMIQLSSGLKDTENPMPVIHLTQLLSEIYTKNS
ncbi:MAG: (Fe-S)-binding protein [Bacillota bacterium]